MKDYLDLPMSKLVTIGATPATPPAPKAFPLYAALVKSAEDIHYALGSKKLCGMCFAGKLQDGKSRGCCMGCENITPKGCANKSAICAIHVCQIMRNLYPAKIQSRMWAIKGSLPGFNFDYHNRGLRSDLREPWSEADLNKMRAGVLRFKRLLAYVKKNKLRFKWDKKAQERVGYIAKPN